MLFGPIDALVSAGLTVSLGGRLGGPVVSAERPNRVAGAPRFGWEKCWRTAMVGNTLLTRTSGPVGRPSFHVANFTLSNLRGGAVLGVVVPEFQPRDGPTTSAVETSSAWGYDTQRGRMLHDDDICHRCIWITVALLVERISAGIRCSTFPTMYGQL